MTAGGGVGVLDKVANAIHSPEEGMVSLAHHDLRDFLIAIDRFAELIAADREYDEANKALFYALIQEVGKALSDAEERFETAKSRRASALAALEQKS